jgi:DNA mismatch repair protein MutS
VVGFTSILYPGSGAMTAVDAPPDCFSDLHLDEIVARVTAGHGDDQLDRFFFAPLHEVVAVEHRQQVFRDLDHDETHAIIQNFVNGMRTMRRRLHLATHVWHPLQRQGWSIYAVETYCDTVAMLRRPGSHSAGFARLA